MRYREHVGQEGYGDVPFCYGFDYQLEQTIHQLLSFRSEFNTQQLTCISLGCGYGRDVRAVRQSLPNARIVGLDISSQVLPSALENGADVVLTCDVSADRSTVERLVRDSFGQILLVATRTHPAVAETLLDLVLNYSSFGQIVGLITYLLHPSLPRDHAAFDSMNLRISTIPPSVGIDAKQVVVQESRAHTEIGFFFGTFQ